MRPWHFNNTFPSQLPLHIVIYQWANNLDRDQSRLYFPKMVTAIFLVPFALWNLVTSHQEVEFILPPLYSGQDFVNTLLNKMHEVHDA